jgi:hypothetical protein
MGVYMTKGDRVVLRRCLEAGPGVLAQRHTNGYWKVVFDDANWPPRWVSKAEMTAEATVIAPAAAAGGSLLHGAA